MICLHLFCPFFIIFTYFYFLSIIDKASQSNINFIMPSPSKLFSCVDSGEICSSPLNLSPAKLQYSFSRDSRFKLPAPYCDQMYNLPCTKMKRNTSFGYGKKTDLDVGKHRHNITPSPDCYQIDSFVDSNQAHKRGSSTHIGRERTAPRSYIELDRIKFPGPGRYDQFRYNQTPKWTMRPINNPERTPLHHQFEKTTVMFNPGPGRYQYDDRMNKTGKYFSSSKVWNPPSSQRFNKSTTGVPGAGSYNPNNDINDSGRYVLSSTRGAGRRRFDKEFRDSFVHEPAKVTKTPGPGSYRLPSDFGQYDLIAASKSQIE